MEKTSEIRHRVHELIDQLPPSQVAALEGLLHSMIHPVPVVDGLPVAKIEEFLRPEWEAPVNQGSGFTFEELVEECGVPADQIREVESERGKIRKIRFAP